MEEGSSYPEQQDATAPSHMVNHTGVIHESRISGTSRSLEDNLDIQKTDSFIPHQLRLHSGYTEDPLALEILDEVQTYQSLEEIDIKTSRLEEHYHSLGQRKDLIHKLLLEHLYHGFDMQSSLGDDALQECEPFRGPPRMAWRLLVMNYGKLLADHGFTEIQTRSFLFIAVYDFTGKISRNFMRYCYWARNAPFFPDLHNELVCLTMQGYTPNHISQGCQSIIAPDSTVHKSLKVIALKSRITREALLHLHDAILSAELDAKSENLMAEQGKADGYDNSGDRQSRITGIINRWCRTYVRWACRRCGEASVTTCKLCDNEVPLCIDCIEMGCHKCDKNRFRKWTYEAHSRHRLSQRGMFCD